MNVIIRLQNLPWSANATDIRNFFKGLMIPEGGVHIVGGENGDAFIAFSTDEDARQAMGRNGGKIKEIQVSLLLSSRAEMQKVIEKARQASASSFMSKISATQASSVMSAAAIANQFAKKMPEPSIQVIPPQAPVISLTNFLTQSMQQQGQQNTPGLHGQQLNLMPAYQTMPPSDIPGLGGLTSVTPVSTSLPTIPLGLPQNAAAAAAAYANYYATLMDPNALNYVNSIAAAGMSTKSIESQRDTYNNDPRNQRSNSREQHSERRQRSRSLERKSARRSRSNSRERYEDSDEKGKDDRRRRTRFSAATDKPEVPRTLAPSIAKSTPVYGLPPPASNGVWDNPPPQLFGIDKQTSIPINKPNQFSNFNNGSNSLPPPTRNYQTENKSTDSAFGNIGTCVKVGNVDNETFYSDIRKFFTGLPIGNNDIKFLTDSKNNRTGIVLVRFLSSDSKKKALTKSMWQLKSTQVMITSITEEDFETGLMNKIGASRQGGNSNDNRNDDRRDRYKDRTDDHDFSNRNPNRQDSNNRSNNRFDDRQRDNNRDQGNFNRNQSGNYRESDGNNREQGNNFRREQNKNFRSDRVEEQEKAKYMPDVNFTVLAIDDIPRTANEPDICGAFPNILSIVIDRYTAYVKFSSHEAAKATLENRFIHYIRNKRVFLEAGSLTQFNELARKLGKFENRDANYDESVGSENRDDNFNAQVNEDSNSRDSSSRTRDQTQFESRDPRQRNFSNDRSGGNDRMEQQSGNDRFGDNGQSQNFLNTDCVIMKNMDTNTTIEDVEFFYKDIGIHKMRVHILLDKRGHPCGDCFVEFKFPNDSQRAVLKNNQIMKKNRIQVMQIPREQVEAVLSSFGGSGCGSSGSGGGNGSNDGQTEQRQQNRQNQSRPDWAPPNDFGSPGCVVMLSNLSYKASIDDILDEFREFDLSPDQIIRRFNDMGQPTGNACINFNSQDDAEIALDKYNSVAVLGRPVWLKRF